MIVDIMLQNISISNQLAFYSSKNPERNVSVAIFPSTFLCLFWKCLMETAINFLISVFVIILFS